ncbi:MAG: flavodoxin-dependent (E)-4-hydroxy-3-methylbut-2-enyl-diphosphate synthase [Caldisericaceae bacterium]
MRRDSRVVRVGSVLIGGNNPIAVQSMTKTDTRDVSSTVDEILKLEDKGCEIIRVAVPDLEAAYAIKGIKDKIHIPLVADIHFDPRLAIESIKNGVDKVRLNPSNIKDRDYIRKITLLAKSYGVAIRIGANLGSFRERPKDVVEALIQSAMNEVKILEDEDFSDIVISIKTSDVLTTIKANEKVATLSNYPIHLGVTEAGPADESLVKSSVGIGALLLAGIGDTLRVSITGDSGAEIEAGFTLLKSLGLREKGIDVISCPTCGRTEIDVLDIVAKVKKVYGDVKLPLKIAVMGCVVNGPGEAMDADIGIAGGKNSGVIFRKGKIVKVVEGNKLFEALKDEIDKYIKES